MAAWVVMPHVRAGLPVRVQSQYLGAVRAVGGGDRSRPRQDVSDGASGGQVRRRVRVLPPGGSNRDRVPGLRARRRHHDGGCEGTPDADAHIQGAEVLLRGHDGHQGGRPSAAHQPLCLLHRWHARRLRHGDHAAPSLSVQAAEVGVRQGHGGSRVPGGPRVRVLRHVLQPDGAPGDLAAAHGVAGVPRRRELGCGRNGDPVRGQRLAFVPGVRGQRQGHRRGRHREHAAEDVQHHVRHWQEGRRLHPRSLLMIYGSQASDHTIHTSVIFR
jgi:hypothetical protein